MYERSALVLILIRFLRDKKKLSTHIRKLKNNLKKLRSGDLMDRVIPMNVNYNVKNNLTVS